MSLDAAACERCTQRSLEQIPSSQAGLTGLHRALRIQEFLRALLHKSEFSPNHLIWMLDHKEPFMLEDTSFES